MKSRFVRFVRLFGSFDQIPKCCGNTEMSVAQFSSKKGSLFQAEERSARVSAMQHVLALFVVAKGRDVAALDARGFVAIERAFVDAKSLQSWLHDFKDQLACAEIGQII